MIKLSWQSLRSWLTIYRLILIATLIVFVALLLYGFPDSSGPWFDEGINLGIAKSWVQHGVYSMQIGPNAFVAERSLLITTNYPLLGFIALAFKLFGVGLAQAKLVMIGFLIIFVFLFFKLIKKHYGPEAALIGLVLLVTFLPLYGNGKSALGEIPGLTYFLLGLLWLDKKKPAQVFVMGLWFGLAAATKSLYILFLVSVAVGEIWSAIKNKKIDYRRWLWLALGVAIPLLIWVYTLLPKEAIGGFFQKMFQYYSNPYKTDQGAIGANLKRFFTESTPLHFALLWLTFLIIKAINRFRSITVLEVMITTFIILDIIFYTKTVGWYRYFFPAHIFALFLFPGAFLEIRRHWSLPQWIKMRGVHLVIIALCAAQSINLLLHLRDSVYFDPEPRRLAKAVSRLVPKDAPLLVIDNPALAFLIDHELMYQYVRLSVQILVGENLRQDNNLPSYILAQDTALIPYANIQLAVRDKYDKVLQGKKYNLYHLRKVSIPKLKSNE